jgi:hypothetical protein
VIFDIITYETHGETGVRKICGCCCIHRAVANTDYFRLGGDPPGSGDCIVEPGLTKSRICPRRVE